MCSCSYAWVGSQVEYIILYMFLLINICFIYKYAYIEIQIYILIHQNQLPTRSTWQMKTTTAQWRQWSLHIWSLIVSSVFAFWFLTEKQVSGGWMLISCPFVCFGPATFCYVFRYVQPFLVCVLVSCPFLIWVMFAEWRCKSSKMVSGLVLCPLIIHVNPGWMSTPRPC